MRVPGFHGGSQGSMRVAGLHRSLQDPLWLQGFIGFHRITGLHRLYRVSSALTLFHGASRSLMGLQ